MLINLDEVATGTLINAITAIGRLFRIPASKVLRSSRLDRDLEVARWFDTFGLTRPGPELPDLSPALGEQLGEVLRGDEVQALLQLLLAARLTDAPETDVTQIRANWDTTLALGGPELAPAAEALLDYYDDKICEIVARLEAHEPTLLAQIRNEALNQRIIALLSTIERHTAAISTGRDLRRDADFLARYRRHVIDQHGKIQPPDFERRRRVPIADIYVPTSISQEIFPERDVAPRELDIWQLAGEIDRTVLLGDPGGGKTTAANVLAHYLASDKDRRIPFLITLRDFAAQDPPQRSVVGHIEHTLETLYQCPPPPGLVDRLLLTGRALMIFDGLDELLDTSRRTDVSMRVERFCTEYPLARVLVTSRAVGYDQAHLDDRQFVRYRLGGFGNEQVGEYVRKWFALEEANTTAGAERSADAFMDESASVRDLRANPLMLSLMCILYRGEGSLPRSRADVYRQCANLLFRAWDARRHIHHDLRAGHLLEPSLRHLAWWLFARDATQTAVTERELVNETSEFLHGTAFESETDARDAAAEFVAFCRGRMWVFSDVGTTAADEPLYAFTHRTFLEYFAAAHLAFDCDTPEHLARRLASHVARDEWDVVGELAVQIKDHTSNGGAQRVYTSLLRERRQRSPVGRSGVLKFLTQCLRSVDPSPQVVRELTRATLDHLFAVVGELNTPIRCMPLCRLLANCGTCKELVRDEISERVDAMVNSGDPATRLNGLRLAVELPVLVQFSDHALWVDGSLMHFWQECADTNINCHSAAIAATAVEAPDIRATALRYEIITMDRALKMPGGLFALLPHSPPGTFIHISSDYLLGTIYALAKRETDLYDQGQSTSRARAIRDLAIIGNHLICHPQPPWAFGTLKGRFHLNWGYPAASEVTHKQLTPAAYLGTVTTVLLLAEFAQVSISKEVTRQSGIFYDLAPYIDRRSGIEIIDRRSGFEICPELPDIPVPDEFKQMFHDWAENKINFMGPEPPADLAEEARGAG
jgi:hypothetical protein